MKKEKVMDEMLEGYIQKSIEILKDNLVGIYLHGSAVMGCFNPVSSDVDLIIVVKDTVKDDVKLEYMKMITTPNELIPQKGIEMSIVKEEDCNPFVYPTPFELHYSIMHLDWFHNDPDDYVKRMKGIDKDLAAHFTIITHRGKCLYGKEIKKVFGEVAKEYYFDSLWNDICEAPQDILDNTMYIILNLCRVLAFKQGGLVLSKAEGAKWGKDNLPEKYHSIISLAEKKYIENIEFQAEESILKEYADYMLTQIKK